MPGNKIQSIERAATILRLVAQRSQRGARFTDLVRESNLTKGTAHRVLAALATEGLIDQDEQSSLYFPGIALVGLGQAASARFDLTRTILPVMLRLAEKTDDTIYFSVRRGNEAICLQRVEGQFPIKTLTLNIADRRPLGIGAGSLALLAFLPDDEVDRIISSMTGELAVRGRTTGELHAMVQESRRLGYAFNDQKVISGMSAVALPIRNSHGHPVAALSVAAISARMDPVRKASTVALIESEVALLNHSFNTITAEPLRSPPPPPSSFASPAGKGFTA